MAIMVVVTPKGRFTLDVSSWDERTRQAVALSAESDGYQVSTGFGVPA